MNVEEIAQRVGGEVAGDPQLQITGVAGLEFAGPNDLTFADSARAVERIAATRSGCALIPAGTASPGRTTISVPTQSWRLSAPPKRSCQCRRR